MVRPRYFAPVAVAMALPAAASGWYWTERVLMASWSVALTRDAEVLVAAASRDQATPLT